jgi:hypothetical protein
MVAQFQIPKRCYKRIDLFASVVKRERGTHGTFHTEAPQDGLCAVMARPDRDTLAI